MHRLLMVVAAGLVASCAASTQAPKSGTDASSLTTGAGASCVELTRIREARVVDDRTIDFYLRDGTTLRNMLPNQCPGLGFERAFSYSTSLSRLCSTDIITVIQSSGPRLGASCGLGYFASIPASPTSR